MHDFFVSYACTWFEQCQAGGPECTQIKRMCPSGRPRTHPDHEQKPKVAATIWVKNHGFRNKEALYCHFSAPFLHCNIFLLRENTLHFFRGALIFLRPFCARPHHPFPQLVREPFPQLVRERVGFGDPQCKYPISRVPIYFVLTPPPPRGTYLCTQNLIR